MSFCTKSKAGLVAAVIAVIGAMPIMASASIITSWNFEAPNTVAANIPVSPTPNVGTGTATVLGMTNTYPTPGPSMNTSDILQGVTGDTGANSQADTGQTWRIRGQKVTGGSSAGNGWSSAAPLETQGAQFAVPTTGFTGISVAFDWYATTQGEANLELQYTTNGSTWNNVVVTDPNIATDGLAVKTNSSSALTITGSYLQDSIGNSPTKAGQDWFQGLTATITDPAAANDASFAFRMVNASTGADDISTQNAALNNSSGNWRFDNISVSGTAVPEPASVGVLGLSGLALLARRRTQVAK